MRRGGHRFESPPRRTTRKASEKSGAFFVYLSFNEDYSDCGDIRTAFEKIFFGERVL
ncbi:hypothetical protein FVB9288_02543 [Flavobacterium sp. CECT 9288]|nr:hypothetical protein FVB9288_02543 [Flavobacterium sp. CECT 9288]